jgi:hypothetical protein
MRRAAAAAVLALFALAGAPALRALAPDAAAQDKDKDQEKEKEAERKRKEEEERKKREKARLEKAILAIANGFGAKDVNAVLLNVADDATVELRLRETDKKKEQCSFSKTHARGVLDAFFKDWRIIRVDTRSISVDQDVASFPLGLFKDSEKDTKAGKRLRIKVGSAEDKHPLVKLVVEW